eukprot:GHVP01024218.1.p1 GENE.GHVP01024218.1~~GHVP01024218.1.p1  ORF type:complete len:238 (+),score=45.61 GHVP01024218.1:1365-2078(+)
MDDRRAYPKSYMEGPRNVAKQEEDIEEKYSANKLPVSLDQIRNELLRQGNSAINTSPTAYSPKTDSFSMTNSKQTDGTSVPRPIRRRESPICDSGSSENVLHLKQNNSNETEFAKNYSDTELCEFGDGQQYAEIIAELLTYYDLCARSKKRHLIRLEEAKFVMKTFEQSLSEARSQEEVRWKRTEELRANLESADCKFEDFCENAMKRPVETTYKFKSFLFICLFVIKNILCQFYVF